MSIFKATRLNRSIFIVSSAYCSLFYLRGVPMLSQIQLTIEMRARKLQKLVSNVFELHFCRGNKPLSGLYADRDEVALSIKSHSLSVEF